MAFDGIVTKAICSELEELVGARIDKIFEPDKNTILIGFYINNANYCLNICLDSSNYRINLTTHQKANPKVAPNFCIVLRKYLIGMRIKNFVTNDLERVVTIELEGFNDIDDIINYKLIVELMGKHCNVILLDETNTIIDCLRHITIKDDSNNKTRNLLPHSKYKYPTTTKLNFMDTSFDEFKKIIDDNYIDTNTNTNYNSNNTTSTNLTKLLANTFNGFSKSFIQNSLNYLNLNLDNISSIRKLYDYFKLIINNTDSLALTFKTVTNEKNKKDYFLVPSGNELTQNNDNNNNKNNTTPNLNLNFFIDDFYYQKESSENFKIYRNSILKLILEILKKYNTRLLNIDEKLKECENMDTYKKYGELITANLYKIENKNLSYVEVEDYYNNLEKIKIPLNKKYLPNVNAKLYFKKYSKLKNTLEIVTIQKEETKKELSYIESIVYELENCHTIEEVSEIYDEISENVIFKEKLESYTNSKNNNMNNKNNKIYLKKKLLSKNKEVTFNPNKYVVDGYTVLVRT